MVDFHLPVIPYSPIDALNRAAAAKGSPRYAEAATYANYNGHHITVSWNSYRGYYVCEYYWGGRVVLTRGSFAACLREALVYYERGDLGSSVSLIPKADDAEAIKLCEADPRIKKGSLWKREADGTCSLSEGSWYTWRHQVAAQSAKDMANPHCPTIIFDWHMLQNADTREDYEEGIRIKYGRVYQ